MADAKEGNQENLAFRDRVELRGSRARGTFIGEEQGEGRVLLDSGGDRERGDLYDFRQIRRVSRVTVQPLQ